MLIKAFAALADDAKLFSDIAKLVLAPEQHFIGSHCFARLTARPSRPRKRTDRQTRSPNLTTSCWPPLLRALRRVSRPGARSRTTHAAYTDIPAFLAALPRDQTQVESPQNLAIALVLGHLTGACKNSSDLQAAVVRKFLSLAAPSLLLGTALAAADGLDGSNAFVKLLDELRTISATSESLFFAYRGIFEVVVSNLDLIAWPEGKLQRKACALVIPSLQGRLRTRASKT